MDHIKSRFVEGSIVNPSRGLSCLKLLLEKEYLISNDNLVITGYFNVDEILNQIISFTIRDFIIIWYRYIGENVNFKKSLENMMKDLLAKLCIQLKNVNYYLFFTKTFVEDFVNHIRLFKYSLKTLQRNCTNVNEKSLFYSSKTSNRYMFDMYNDLSKFEIHYFEVENNSEGFVKCHKDVSIKTNVKKSYFKQFAQMLIYLLIPNKEFNRVTSYIYSNVMVNYILIPVFDLIADPDFINQQIIKMLSDYAITNEVFLEVIRVLDTVEDLESIKEILIQEIARERSKDIGGYDDSEIKQRLQSLAYLQRIIESRIKRILQGTPYTEWSYKYKALSPDQNEYLKNIHFPFVLDHALSLEYFLNYLSSMQHQNYMYFYLTVESFRTLALQHVPPEYIMFENEQYQTKTASDSNAQMHSQPISIKLVRNEAQKIFDQYLAERAPHQIKLNSVHVKTVRSKIKNEIPRVTWFDDLQYEVYQLFVRGDGLFESFKKSDTFYKMLAELDLLPDSTIEACAFSDSAGLSLHELNFEEGVACPESISTRKCKSNSLRDLDRTFTLQDDIGNLQYTQSSVDINHSNDINGFENQLPINTTMKNTQKSADAFRNNQTFNHLEREYKMTAHVTHIVVSQDLGKTYAMYAINVTREPLNLSASLKSLDRDDEQYNLNKNNKMKSDLIPSTSSSSTKCKSNGYLPTQQLIQQTIFHTNNKNQSWLVYRRYSEFHDLHMNLRDKFQDVETIKFPPKKPFGNMTKDFLDKRLKTLDSYLKTLMSPEFVKTHKNAKDMLEQFLEPGLYEKWNGQIARKMDTIINPFKSSVRFVGNVVKTVPVNIADNVVRGVSDTMKDGVGKFIHLTQNIPMLRLLIDETIHSEISFRKASLSDIEDEDNVTFKIIILLMDEIFDLRNRNQWLRHRLMVIIRQLFQVAFGGTLNKKVIEQIDKLTSADQIAEYLKKFRDSFWPNGVWTGSYSHRTEGMKSRTKILALAKIFAAIPDEIKTLVGSETTREGIKMIFDMLQFKAINRRFLFTFLIEDFIPLLFPFAGRRIVKILTDKYLNMSNRSSSYKSPSPVSSSSKSTSPDIQVKHKSHTSQQLNLNVQDNRTRKGDEYFNTRYHTGNKTNYTNNNINNTTTTYSSLNESFHTNDMTDGISLSSLNSIFSNLPNNYNNDDYDDKLSTQRGQDGQSVASFNSLPTSPSASSLLSQHNFIQHQHPNTTTHHNKSNTLPLTLSNTPRESRSQLIYKVMPSQEQLKDASLKTNSKNVFDSVSLAGSNTSQQPFLKGATILNDTSSSLVINKSQKLNDNNSSFNPANKTHKRNLSTPLFKSVINFK